MRHVCVKCGICCDCYSIMIEASDIVRWKEEDRQDILDTIGLDHETWIDPITGQAVEGCPHKDRAVGEGGNCTIHDTKPLACRAWPTNQRESGYFLCEGIWEE